MHFKPTISVIIPCREHYDELKGCLRELENQRPIIHHEIIVVVSSVNDEKLSKVISAFPHVHIIRGNKSMLAGEARNLGVKYAKSKYLAFIDADCLPEHGWLNAAKTALDLGFLFVGGPVLDFFPFHPIAASDNLLQLLDFTSYRPSGMASHLPGGNMGVDRDAFHKIGGFVSGIAVGEDTILSSAAAKKWPQKVYFSKDMCVRHYGRRRIKEFLHHQQRFGYFRAVFGMHTSSIYLRLGQIIGFSYLIALKRMAYFSYRALQWRPILLLRIFILLPFLLLGLTAWAVGFWKGCRARIKET